MLFWLIGVVVAIGLWALMWQRQPKMAFGVLLGLLVAWIISRLIAPYISGVEQVPVWLPPLPFALVATFLFALGALVWFRGAPPVHVADDRHGEHH